jgi:hypothetical protein
MEMACELVKSGGADRDLLQYRLALELCDSLAAAYAPPRFPARPFLLEGKTFAEVEASLGNASFALAVGSYRAAVTELEALSAQRLSVVCSTIRTLCKLGDRTSDEHTLKRIDGMLTRLGAHLTLAWNLDLPADNADLRTWSVQATRRYDLLPRSWRFV